MIGIYKITSPTKKVYIGKSVDIDSRFIDYKKRSCKSQIKLYASLTKHGASSHKFEIVHELPIDIEPEVLDRYECFYINQYKDCGFEMMNLKEGGKGGRISEESILKMKESLKGRIPPNKGRILSTEQRARLSIAFKGRKAHNKGVPMSEEQRAKQTGVIRTEETRKKISAARTGMQVHKIKGEGNHNSKLKEADISKIRLMAGQPLPVIAKQFGVSKGTIWDILKNKTWTHVTS
jgi:group I intron endonuclease